MPTRVTARTIRKKIDAKRKPLATKARKNKKCKSYPAEMQTKQINDIMKQQKRLSNKNIALQMDENSGAIETSYSILNSLGISVDEEINNINHSIIGEYGIDSKKIEKLDRTRDQNPNRLPTKRLQNLQSVKVKSSDLFDDSISNPIFKLDECAENVRKIKAPELTNVIQVTKNILDVLVLPPGDDGRIGGFIDTSMIQDPNLRRDSNIQTTGTGRGTTGAQGDGRGGVDTAFGSGVINRGGSY